jgi:hypothetical protein
VDAGRHDTHTPSGSTRERRAQVTRVHGPRGGCSSQTCCSYEEGGFAGDLDAQSGESHTSLRVTPLHVFTIVRVFVAQQKASHAKMALRNFSAVRARGPPCARPADRGQP